ncbi:MAG: hypothetical protein IJC71_01775 [Clostridia bacterium]|nr:hypothetical protein [Clostridia bacterium]
MTAEGAIHAFWASFGVPAYEKHAVPEDTAFPYIAYSLACGAMGEETGMTADLYCGGSSRLACHALASEIEASIGGGRLLACDKGTIWLRRASPFLTAEDAGGRDLCRSTVRITAMFLTRV